MKKTAMLILLLLLSLNVTAEEINNDMLFKGIIKQSHDFSCGSGALATLIAGTVENSHISENDIINLIPDDKKETGYSAYDLQETSKKLGYDAQWRKIKPTELPKIKQPVILVIGLNSEFFHYVVIKGIKDEQAFLADPLRGNIRVSYQELIKEGLNEKYPSWFVMAIKPSPNKPKDSILYLSENERERFNNHLTIAQSNAITSATLSKQGQIIAQYGFNAALGNNKINVLKINSQTFSHVFDLRYGLTNAIEIGTSIQQSDTTVDFQFDNSKFRSDDSNRQYRIYGNRQISLDDSGQTNLNFGLSGSYVEKNDVFGGGLNIVGYRNSEWGQFVLGGSLSKEFSHNQLANDLLPDYAYNAFIGANTPLGDRYRASLQFSLDDAKSKSDQIKPTYSVSTSLTYGITDKFQVSPSFTYSFGTSEVFSFGMNIAYVGGW